MKVQSAALGLAALATLVSAQDKKITIPFVKKAQISHSSPYYKRAIYNSPIYNYYGSAYIVTVDVGTPGQSFNVVLDTGSSDFWIPAANCPATECPSTTFNEAASSTFKSLGTAFNITYGLGSSAGTYGTDTVSIGGVSVTNQTIGLASSTSNVISLSANNGTSDPQAINGVLGVGFPALTASSTDANTSYNPFVFNLLAQNLIADPVFAIYLSATDKAGWTGQVTFGGVDTTKYQGDITYVPLAPLTSEAQGTNYYYWMTYAASLGVINSPIKDVTATVATVAAYIFDTGTTFTYFPSNIASSVFTSMTGASPTSVDPSSGAYLIQCSVGSNAAVFQLQLRSSKSSTSNPVVLNVPLSELLIPVGTSTDGTAVCAFGIVPQDTQVGTGLYIVGDSILRSFYTVYDMKQNRIGLAPAVGMKSSIQGGNSTSTANHPSASSGGNNAGSPTTATTVSSSGVPSMQISALFTILSIILSIKCM